MLTQQRTPFDIPFLRQGLTAALDALNRITFGAFILLLEQNLGDNFFPTPGKTPGINIHNPDVVEPEVDRVDEGSPGKRRKQVQESCRVDPARTPTAPASGRSQRAHSPGTQATRAPGRTPASTRPMFAPRSRS